MFVERRTELTDDDHYFLQIIFVLTLFLKDVELLFLRIYNFNYDYDIFPLLYLLAQC